MIDAKSKLDWDSRNPPRQIEEVTQRMVFGRERIIIRGRSEV